MWLGLNAILQIEVPHAPLDVITSSATGSSAPLQEPWLSGLDSLTPDHVQGLELPERARPTLTQWPLTFEAIIQAMEVDGNIYSEGDGSFVLCGTTPADLCNESTFWVGQLPRQFHCAPTVGWRPPTSEPTASTTEVVWRIEGNVVDGLGAVSHISVIGAAPVAEWRRLIRLILPSQPSNSAGPAIQPVLQLHQFGRYVALPI